MTDQIEHFKELIDEIISEAETKATALEWGARVNDKSINTAVDALLSEIMALVEANRWIPCAEGLPETHRDLGHDNIIHNISETVYVDWFYSNYNDESRDKIMEWREVKEAMIIDNMWLNLDDGSEIKIDDILAPTYWRNTIPLPKPPEPQS